MKIVNFLQRLLNKEKFVDEFKIKFNDNKQMYVIVRGNSSGVFSGFLIKKEGQTVELIQCRRLWRWEGASSISQLAISGTSNPMKCKFPEETIKHTLLDAIEIIACTEKAYDIIKSVPIWKS